MRIEWCVMFVEVRKNGILKWVRPDGKTQVVIAYRNVGGAMVPVRVHTIVISTQHEYVGLFFPPFLPLPFFSPLPEGIVHFFFIHFC